MVVTPIIIRNDTVQAQTQTNRFQNILSSCRLLRFGSKSEACEIRAAQSMALLQPEDTLWHETLISL
jgi:hypothetical protein